MSTGLEHGSIAHANNQIGIHNRGKTVGDKQHGATLEALHQVFTHHPLGLIIER